MVTTKAVLADPDRFRRWWQARRQAEADDAGFLRAAIRAGLVVEARHAGRPMLWLTPAGRLIRMEGVQNG